MELLGDVGHVESHFGPFIDNVVSVQDRCTVCTRRYSLVTRLKWKPFSVRLDLVLILTQDRCTVCTKHTIGLEIILDAPDGTLTCRGSSGASFQSIG